MLTVRITDRKDLPIEIINNSGSTLYTKNVAIELRNKLNNAISLLNGKSNKAEGEFRELGCNSPVPVDKKYMGKLIICPALYRILRTIEDQSLRLANINS